MEVLYATDGSEAAQAVGEILEKLGRRDDVRVTVLAVAPPIEGEPNPLIEDAVKRLQAAGFEARGLEEAAKDAGAHIVEVAEREGADLIAIGAGQKTWLDRLMLGSVSTRVLHAAQVSTLLTHRSPTDTVPARVLVGSDGSSDGALALRELVALADAERCEVEVLSVVQLPAPTPTATGFATEAFDEHVGAELTAAAEQIAERAATELETAGFRVHRATPMGAASMRLLERAEEWGADLVVVGSRGMGPVDRVVLGSVSDKVARHARAGLIARRADR